MVVPPPGSTLVIERVRPASADKAIVASADPASGIR